MIATAKRNLAAITAAAAFGLLAIGPLQAGKLTFIPAEGQTSTISIDGTSNVRDWDAQSEKIEGAIEIEADGFWLDAKTAPARLLANGEAAISATVRVPAASLTSSSRRLTSNLHDYLETDDHPYIEFKLSSLELMDDNGPETDDEVDSFETRVEGELTVSGDTGTISFPVAWKRDGHHIHLSGEVELKMSDFGIDPPTMMFGSLRTADELRVKFDWVLAPE
jgi:polyisoprenoid-binding protein YceI